MAGETLPEGYIEAGRQFDESLRALGFKPEGLLWAWDKTLSEFVLLLVTRHLDHAGPVELFRLLTEAYNRSATPKEISPFIVRAHSPNQAIIRGLIQIDAQDTLGRRMPNVIARGEVLDIAYVNHWVYYWPNPQVKMDPITRNREWRRFRQSVEKLAA